MEKSFSTCTIFCTLLVSRDESRQQWNMCKRPFPAIAKDMMHCDSHSSTPSASHALYSHATKHMCRREKLPSPVTLLVTQMDRVAEVGRSFPGKRDRASKPEPPCASALHHLRIHTPHTFLLHIQLPPKPHLQTRRILVGQEGNRKRRLEAGLLSLAIYPQLVRWKQQSR